MFIQVFNLKGFNYLCLMRSDSTDRLHVNKAGYKLWIKELDGFTVVGTRCGQVGGYAQGKE